MFLMVSEIQGKPLLFLLVYGGSCSADQFWRALLLVLRSRNINASPASASSFMEPIPAPSCHDYAASPSTETIG